MSRDKTLRLRDERGVATFLFAILVPLLLLPIGAIAVDVGFWYTNAKRAQSTADAAALAAAREIPNLTNVEARAAEYVALNLPDATHTVEYPYVPGDGVGATGHLDEVEVRVRNGAPTFFGRIFGVFGVESERRAVAQKREEPGNLAIFAHSDDCTPDNGALVISGSDVFVNGLVHSNGLFRVEGDEVWAAEATLNRDVCPSSIDENADPVQFGGGMPPPWCGQLCRLPNDDSFQDWPQWWTPLDFGWLDGCTEWGTRVEIVPGMVTITNNRDTGVIRTIPFTNGNIPAGTYCGKESFSVVGDDLHGQITGLALEVAVDGDNLDLSPYQGGMLLFRVPNTTVISDDDGSAPHGEPTCNASLSTQLQLNGDNQSLEGVVFNPCGVIAVDTRGGSAGPALTGTLLGESVNITGDGFRMVGANDFSARIQLALVE